MEIKTFGVIGAGQMGNGIAQVAAASGLQVVMSDIKEDFTSKGVANITRNLARSVEKGKLECRRARCHPRQDQDHDQFAGHAGGRLCRRGGGRT